ncbi:MAG: aminoacyl-tRNA hydrolase [Vicinamibacterales bacterium]|nr:aminoacyl-tRNA hydrolase [Vicinamibacterales bacterium]
MLLVGLGNPGPRYRGTFHNVGFEVVDEIARRHGVLFGASPADALVARIRRAAGDVLLVKPLTFMNLSGRAVGDLQRFYKVEPEAVLVIADDVNLPSGRLRLRARGSAGGHNGLRSIIAGLGTDAFPRLRVGVGRGDPRRDLADHVLARVPADERDQVRLAVDVAADAAECFVEAGVLEAMNRFNAAPKTPEGTDTVE